MLHLLSTWSDGTTVLEGVFNTPQEATSTIETIPSSRIAEQTWAFPKGEAYITKFFDTPIVNLVSIELIPQGGPQ